MLEYRIFQVDAFTSHLFGGNSAAVVPVKEWPGDDLLQAIAMENNLSETAFFAPAGQEDADFHLRWFTPTVEVDLCGHATLATAHILFNELDWPRDSIRFATKSAGILGVTHREGNLLELDFPARPGDKFAIFDDFIHALGDRPAELLLSRDHMAVFTNEAQVKALDPDMEKLARINEFGVIVTAPSDDPAIDFVSRFFAPNCGIPEDPVTGSAHCMLAPYWAQKLGKTKLRARQISSRQGDLFCEYQEDTDRVLLAGQAVTYLTGMIRL